MSSSLNAMAATLGERLKARGDTIAVAESSAGGLISAALLAVPGASAYFLGGGVIYTRAARRALLGLPEDVISRHPAPKIFTKPGSAALGFNNRNLSVASLWVSRSPNVSEITKHHHNQQYGFRTD